MFFVLYTKNIIVGVQIINNFNNYLNLTYLNYLFLSKLFILQLPWLQRYSTKISIPRGINIYVLFIVNLLNFDSVP